MRHTKKQMAKKPAAKRKTARQKATKQQVGVYRRRLPYVILALVLVAVAYLCFVSPVMVGDMRYARAPYVNNYPEDPAHPGQLFLGDHIALSVAVSNYSIRSFDSLFLKLEFSRGVTIVQVDGRTIGSRSVKEFIIPIKALRARQEHTQPLVISTSQSGYLVVKASLAGNGVRADKSAKRLELQILPRPIDATPRVPADIISYLGDKAIANCKARHPCKAAGCPRYPDSPESKQCLAAENQKLFSGCGEPPMSQATVDAWQACLMKKYGFPAP